MRQWHNLSLDFRLLRRSCVVGVWCWSVCWSVGVCVMLECVLVMMGCVCGGVGVCVVVVCELLLGIRSDE